MGNVQTRNGRGEDMGNVQTRNGRGVRTAEGWVWMCAQCHVTTTLGMAADVQGFDAQRWLDSVDAMHYCEHKN